MKLSTPILLTVTLLSIIFVVWWAYSKITHAPPPMATLATIATGRPSPTIAATPTPMPFAELTIPFLRTRVYSGRLGERTLISENGSYNSYLTSYTSDRLRINAQLTIPTGEMPDGGWPAVVFVHGYIPPAQYNTLEKYTDYVDYIARNEFVVFKIDLRGHGESEGEPSGAYYSSDYVIDTLNAYTALENSDFVNKEKIGLWGHSMAGNIVMRSMAAKPTIPAGVIWAGAVYTYTDFIEYRISDTSYVPLPSSSPATSRRQQIIAAHGDISSVSTYWKQVAPANYLSELTGAVQIHHAVDDDVVSIEYTRNLKRLMDAKSVENEVYEYSYGGHNISGGSWVEAMERTVQFYREQL